VCNGPKKKKKFADELRKKEDKSLL